MCSREGRRALCISLCDMRWACNSSQFGQNRSLGSLSTNRKIHFGQIRRVNPFRTSWDPYLTDLGLREHASASYKNLSYSHGLLS